MTTAKANPEIRRMLQVIGTEAGRDIHGEDCWVKIARQKIVSTDSPVAVVNVRYQNEADMIRDLGGVIVRVTRPGVGPVNGHSSDNQEIRADYEIENDGSIEDLHAKVRRLVGVQGCACAGGKC